MKILPTCYYRRAIRTEYYCSTFWEMYIAIEMFQFELGIEIPIYGS